MQKKQILFYNTFYVERLLKQRKAEEIQSLLSDNFSYELFDQYMDLGIKNFYNPVVDRTNSIPHFMNVPDFSKLNPIPKNDKKFDNFYNIATRVAKDIINKGKPIILFWSGGLDSTFLLSLFVNLSPQKINVICSYNSILESGDVYDRFFKNKVNLIIRPTSSNKKIYEEFKFSDVLFVTGNLGNQLYRHSAPFHNDGYHASLGKKEDFFEKVENVLNDKLVQFFEPMVKAFPIKVETLGNFKYMLNYGSAWMPALYGMHKKNNLEISKKFIHFFEDMEFQRWALYHEEYDPIEMFNSDRKPLRDFLYDNGLKEYSKLKKKHTSVINIEPADTVEWVCLYEDYTNLYVRKI
jgi:hypothetical protein